MSIFEASALFATMAVLAAVPSASVALVLARSATLGVSHGVTVGAGIVIGDLVFVSLVMLGLTVIAEAMGGMFTVVRYVGAVYLLWLGISLLRTKPGPPVAKASVGEHGSYVASLLAGLLLTLGDIKAIVFYLSLLPMFVDLTELRPADALLVLVITVVAVGGVKVLYAFFAGHMAASSGGQRFSAVTKKAAGTALLGAGAYLVVKP